MVSIHVNPYQHLCTTVCNIIGSSPDTIFSQSHTKENMQANDAYECVILHCTYFIISACGGNSMLLYNFLCNYTD